MRSPGAQTILLAGASALAQIATAALFILVARETEIAQYGLVVTAIAVATVGAGLADFGANAHGAREASAGRMTLEEAATRATSRSILVLTAALIGGLAFWLMSREGMLWVAAPVLASLSFSLSTQVALRGIARSDLTASSQVASRTAMLLTALTLWALGAEPLNILWLSLTAGYTLEAAINTILTPAAFRGRIRTGFTPSPWAGSRYIGVFGVANSAQLLDLPLLAAFGGPSAAGLLGAVGRWTQPLGLIAGAYTSALLPFVARAENSAQAWSAARRPAWMLAAAVLLCIAMVPAAPVLVEMLLGDVYTDAVPVLQLLAIGTIPAIVNQPLAVFLQALGFERTVAVWTIACTAIKLISVVITAATFGAVGAAISFVVSQALLSIALVITASRLSRRADD